MEMQSICGSLFRFGGGKWNFLVGVFFTAMKKK